MLHVSFAFVALLAACAPVALQSSSKDHLGDHRATVFASGDTDKLLPAIVEAFGKRGFALADRRVVAGAGLLKFKGVREYWRGSPVGSVFYVRFAKEEGRAMQVFMLGKPTIDGAETCSTADKELEVDCDEVVRSWDWRGHHKVSGREEAETIRGLIAELSLANPEAFTLVPEPEPGPNAERDPSCLARRKEIAERAKDQKDLQRRAQLYQSMPQCALVPIKKEPSRPSPSAPNGEEPGVVPGV